MSASKSGKPVKMEMRAGSSCLLNVLGQYILVDLLEVGEETIRVSFPAKDYPVAGMVVHLDFHDAEGFDSYEAEVLEGPARADSGLVLSRPLESRRTQHRDACRVPTDLTVQIKDQVHVRRYDASLLNLSAGGALIETDAPFDFSTTLELTLSLPGESLLRVLGQVVHISDEAKRKEPGSRLLGVRFVSLDPEARQTVSRYAWYRLRELYPPQ
ncbi:MAG: PilZ domain-containing protein [Candidatus Hydrogenedentes bacterium]|nr:PilZ domain-containing protein [Candidatus Hydrogenedentota bacterium]